MKELCVPNPSYEKLSVGHGQTSILAYMPGGHDWVTGGAKPHQFCRACGKSQEGSDRVGGVRPS